MTEKIQAVILLVALLMLGYGLWLIAPAAMFVGVGGLLMTSIVVTRTVNSHGKRVQKG